LGLANIEATDKAIFHDNVFEHGLLGNSVEINCTSGIMYLARRDPASSWIDGDFGPVPEGNHGSMIMGITGFFTAFACASFILRLYVRIFLLKMMGPDDYVMLIAVVCTNSIVRMQANVVIDLFFCCLRPACC